MWVFPYDRRLSTLIVLVILMMLPSRPADAALVTNVYSFEGSSWNPSWCCALTGDLTVTYDPTIDVTGGSLDDINLLISGHSFTTAEIRFDFFAAPPAAGSDKLIVWGLDDGAALGFFDWDIRLVIDQASTATPILSQFSFTPNTILQQASTVRSVTVASAVPIPAAAWLFGSALGILGWMRRKKA